MKPAPHVIPRIPRAYLTLVPLLVAVGALLSSCGYDQTDPRNYPFRTERVVGFGPTEHGIFEAFDLTGDGVDELLFVTNGTAPRDGQSVHINDINGVGIEQANVDGEIYARLLHVDLDGDAYPELAVPWVRNDSLFLTGYVLHDRRLSRSWEFFVASGRARVDGRQTYRWDPRVGYLDRLQVANGVDRLFVLLNTGYAARPRGVYLFDPATKALTDSLTYGVFTGGVVLPGDYDGDGNLEAVINGRASKNGNYDRGIGDDATWMLHLDLYPKLAVRSLFGGPPHEGRNRVARSSTEDTGSDLLIITDPRTRETSVRPGVLRIRPPFDKAATKLYPIDDFDFGSLDVDLTRDNTNELIIVNRDGRADILDANLDVLSTKRVKPGTRFSLVLERAGSRGQNLIAGEIDRLGYVLFDYSLRPVAYTGHTVRGVARTGLDTPSLIKVGGEIGNDGYLLELRRQPFYLLFRYRRLGALIVLLPLLAALTLVIRRRSSQLRVMRRALDAGGTAIFRYVPATGSLFAESDTATALIGKHRLNRSDLTAFWPELTGVLERHVHGIAWPQEFNIRSAMGRDEVVRVTILPDAVNQNLRGARIIKIEQLGHANHTSSDAWRRLARRIIHDFRTPLSTIRLSAHQIRARHTEPRNGVHEFLDSDPPKGDPSGDNPSKDNRTLAHYASTIETQIDALDATVVEFLRTLDRATETLEATDVSQFLLALIEELRPQLSATIELVPDIEGPTPLVLLDSEEFGSVVTEIIRNAILALDGAGTIAIRVRIDQLFDGNILGVKYGSAVKIEITDSGSGMDPDTLNHIFDSGFTTRPSGTGLGLTIARRVIEGYGGSITARSEQGSGTIITIRLPVIGSGDNVRANHD